MVEAKGKEHALIPTGRKVEDEVAEDGAGGGTTAAATRDTEA